MKAAVVHDVDDLQVLDVPEPDPGPRTLIAVERTGLCGTDLKILRGAIPTQRPLIIGHEMVGTVLRQGSGGLVSEGTRVLVDPGIACGHCDLCRNDRMHLCRNGALMGRDIDGGFAEQIAVDELQLHPIPEHVRSDEAVVMQVLATCVHAQTLVDVFPGQTAVIVGLGVSGLLHVQLLAARGVHSLVGVTRSAWKRDLARQLGATAVAAPEEAAEVVADVTGGRGADLVVESAGTTVTLAQSVDLAGLGATVLVFGIVAAATAELPFYQLYFKELDIRSARAARPRDYARAVQLVADGVVNVRPLVSATYALDDAPAAFDACANSADVLKVLLEVS